MARKKLERVYGNLTPQERFQLSLEAMARGDLPEQERLMETCPRLSYLETDAAYTSRMEAIALFVGALMIDLRPMLAQLQLADGLLYRYLEGPVPLVERSPVEQEFGEVLSIQAMVFACRARSMWEAFGAVCEDELGTKADVVAGAIFPEIRDDMARYDDLIHLVPRDETLEAQYREVLQENWTLLLSKARGRS
jgi:hypothetical protein